MAGQFLVNKGEGTRIDAFLLGGGSLKPGEPEIRLSGACMHVLPFGNSKRKLIVGGLSRLGVCVQRTRRVAFGALRMHTYATVTADRNARPSASAADARVPFDRFGADANASFAIFTPETSHFQHSPLVMLPLRSIHDDCFGE